MSDDEEWKSSFVQGDDAALTAAIKAREAECDPLLRRGPPVAVPHEAEGPLQLFIFGVGRASY